MKILVDSELSLRIECSKSTLEQFNSIQFKYFYSHIRKTVQLSSKVSQSQNDLLDSQFLHIITVKMYTSQTMKTVIMPQKVIRRLSAFFCDTPPHLMRQGLVAENVDTSGWPLGKFIFTTIKALMMLHSSPKESYIFFIYFSG